MCYHQNMSLFIFDMGEVILQNIRTLKGIADTIGVSYRDLRADYGQYEMALMDGYMSCDDYYRHLEDKYSVAITEDLFLTFFHPTVNLPMLSTVDALRANGHRCVVGSNTFHPHWEYIKKMEEKPLEHFDSLYASHIIHMSKPEKAFWRIICTEEGYSCSDTFFIDDREENTAAASELGITALLYAGEDREARAEAFFRPFV